MAVGFFPMQRPGVATLFAEHRYKAFPRCFNFFFLLFIFLAGCATQPAKASVAVKSDIPHLKIAVVHFQRVTPDENTRMANCPLTGAIFRACGSPTDSEKILENLFLEKLRSSSANILIPPDEADAIYKTLSTGPSKVPQSQVLKTIGEKLNADAVLIGYLFCFRERIGYEYAAEKPASVAFGIYLISVKNGSLIWKGVFDKTQQSLFENVFELPSFIKGKGKWVQAEFLLREGVEDVLKTFPDLH